MSQRLHVNVPCQWTTSQVNVKSMVFSIQRKCFSSQVNGLHVNDYLKSTTSQSKSSHVVTSCPFNIVIFLPSRSFFCVVFVLSSSTRQPRMCFTVFNVNWLRSPQVYYFLTSCQSTHDQLTCIFNLFNFLLLKVPLLSSSCLVNTVYFDFSILNTDFSLVSS